MNTRRRRSKEIENILFTRKYVDGFVCLALRYNDQVPYLALVGSYVLQSRAYSWLLRLNRGGIIF